MNCVHHFKTAYAQRLWRNASTREFIFATLIRSHKSNSLETNMQHYWKDRNNIYHNILARFLRDEYWGRLRSPKCWAARCSLLCLDVPTLNIPSLNSNSLSTCNHWTIDLHRGLNHVFVVLVTRQVSHVHRVSTKAIQIDFVWKKLYDA